MNTINNYLLFLFFGLFAIRNNALSEQYALINKKYIVDYLTKDACWSDSHCAQDDFLGTGMLYYCLAYMKKASMCVCLGSGGGFVPRLMRQAQRDLELSKSRTVLVDANMGGYGRPQWLAEDSFFKTEFSDIEIMLETTHSVAEKHSETWQIDYLHIDADHSFEGALQDFRDYLPLMAPDGIITLHDTNGSLPCSDVIKVLNNEGFKFVNFQYLCAGVAIISIKKE